ncbi:MAG: hypothetical protein LBM92_01385 [Opitutaceae bacterium]|jgi:hypothetical protein|nr:hypothetical protein [Opitutaceae bacterium]
MSLTTATLLPGIFLIALGALLLAGNTAIVSSLKALPRSRKAAVVFFGGGALWFLWVVNGLSTADLVLFESPRPFMFIFGAVAVAAFYYVPEFLAVRGLCVLMVLAACPLLRAAFGEYAHTQRLLMVALVYVGVALAMYFAVVPYRMRDFLQWLFTRMTRARALGAALFAYGLLLGAAALTY